MSGLFMQSKSDKVGDREMVAGKKVFSQPRYQGSTMDRYHFAFSLSPLFSLFLCCYGFRTCFAFRIILRLFYQPSLKKFSAHSLHFLEPFNVSRIIFDSFRRFFELSTILFPSSHPTLFIRGKKTNQKSIRRFNRKI